MSAAYQIFQLPKGVPLSAGTILPGAKASFYLTGTSTPTPVYSDSGLTTPHTQPVLADSAGILPVIYLNPTIIYKVTLTTSADVLYYTQDPANDQILTAAIIGALIYPHTGAEITAGVTPSNYLYAEGRGERYGVAGNGSTDDRAAIQRAYSVYKAGGPRPDIRGTCKVLQNGANDYALLLDSHVDLEGLSLVGDGTNNYSLIRIQGGSNQRIKIRRCRFDCGKVTPARPASTNDIGIRIDSSSIDTIDINDCDFLNYVEDGIYISTTVSGLGGSIENCRFTNGYRGAVTIVKGRMIDVRKCRATDINLIPFHVNATDSSVVLRDINIEDNVVLNGGLANTGAIDNVDRAGVFLSGKTGAAVSNQQNLNARNNQIINFANGYAGSALALGIETREITDVVVSGNLVSGTTTTGSKGWGLYSYLTTRAVYEQNTATGCDIGLRMNSCTDYADNGNTCIGNLVNQKNYNGPDGPTTFLRADGLNECLARGSVSFSAGAPVLNSKFNIASMVDNATGDTKFNLTRQAASGNYSVLATLRSFSGSGGAGAEALIHSASHNVGDFRILTLKAGAGSDEAYDFEVRGCWAGTVEP